MDSVSQLQVAQLAQIGGSIRYPAVAWRLRPVVAVPVVAILVVAICCNLLQSIVIHCNPLQSIAIYCIVIHCNPL